MSVQNRWTIDINSEDYPPALRALESAPKKIYGIGNPEFLYQPSLGIIGSRKATPYGLSVASCAGRIAAECGITVVSGGAMGCDFEASRSALARGGNTIIVSGTGADRIYPLSSSSVYRRAWAGKGCVISLQKWNYPPKKWVFPKRNLVIAALCRSLMVVEAAIPSGTMTTALAAENLGKRLYSVPGSIFSPTSSGCNSLIGQGAAIIADELSLEMQIALDFEKVRFITQEKLKDQGRVLSALLACPLSASELSRMLNLNVLCVIDTLADYQNKQIVTLLPDDRYTLTKKGYLGLEFNQ